MFRNPNDNISLTSSSILHTLLEGPNHQHIDYIISDSHIIIQLIQANWHLVENIPHRIDFSQNLIRADVCVNDITREAQGFINRCNDFANFVQPVFNNVKLHNNGLLNQITIGNDLKNNCNNLEALLPYICDARGLVNISYCEAIQQNIEYSHNLIEEGCIHWRHIINIIQSTIDIQSTSRLQASDLNLAFTTIVEEIPQSFSQSTPVTPTTPNLVIDLGGENNEQ